jgi:hypothetical protein
MELWTIEVLVTGARRRVALVPAADACIALASPAKKRQPTPLGTALFRAT